MKHTHRMAVAIGVATIAVGAALGGGAANAAPSPTASPTHTATWCRHHPGKCPTPKPTVKPTPKPTTPTVRKPFRVGWTNQNQGPSPFPGMTDGFQAAVQYINKNGGINGRLIEIVPCYTDQTPQMNQQCGNQFANDPSLNLVMLGENGSAGALFDALKPSALPILISLPSSAPDFTSTNAVSYAGGSSIVGPSIAAVAKKEGAKTVSMVGSDSAAARVGIDSAGTELLKQGIVLNKVVITLPYTDPLPLILQAKASSVDLIANALGTNCLPFLKAQKQLGIPSSKTVTSSNCASAPLIAQDPSLYQGAKVYLFSDDALMGKGVSPDLDLFIDNYPKYAAMSQTGGAPAFAASGWATVFSLRNALKGKPDSVLDNKASLLTALRAFKGPAVMGADVLNCGGYPEWGPALCTDQGVFAQVQGEKYVKYRV